MALMMDHERWAPLPRLRLLLYEMALLYFFPLPHQQGAFLAQLALPVGRGVVRGGECK